jgi:hypothetical protein
MGVLWVFYTLLLWTCVHATWFPKMQLTDTQWSSAVSRYDVASSYKSCKTEYTSSNGAHKFVQFYKDNPVSIVLTGAGEGTLDVKFKDSNYVFDQRIHLSAESYVIVPPYQPVEWVYLRFPGRIAVCSFSGKLKMSPLSLNQPHITYITTPHSTQHTPSHYPHHHAPSYTITHPTIKPSHTSHHHTITHIPPPHHHTHPTITPSHHHTHPTITHIPPSHIPPSHHTHHTHHRHHRHHTHHTSHTSSPPTPQHRTTPI